MSVNHVRAEQPLQLRPARGRAEQRRRPQRPGPRETHGRRHVRQAVSSPVLRPATSRATAGGALEVTGLTGPRSAPPLRMLPLNPHLLLPLLAAAWSGGLLYVAAGEAGGGSCELSVARGGALYNFSLAAPTPAHRHGVLSEDGFYKVAMNDSVIWFQLCDQMIFNFESPVCLRCEDCGGPLRCGTQCSALVSHNIGGYDVCTTIGRASESHISLIDEDNPHKGVIVKMSSSKCSITVFIFCDSAVTQLSDKFSQSGSCDYTTTVRHPSGCARSVSDSGNGWGWLGTSFITMLCLLGGYILIGAIYRYCFLGIRSVEAIPNLDFWISLPQKVKNVFVASTRNPRSRCRDTRGPYVPVNH